MLLDTVTILSIALRNPFVLAVAILSFGSILATLGTPAVAFLLCSQRRGRRQEQQQQQRSTGGLMYHGNRHLRRRSSPRVVAVVLACVLVMVALALLLALRSPYWTFALEAAGWASLAYVSFESGIPKVQETVDESTADDTGSQATVSADAEDAFEDVLFELKGRFSRTEHVRPFPKGFASSTLATRRK
jgi:hypothetical protein